MNILFTGIGGPTPLGLARSIQQAFPTARCIGVDGSPWSTNLYHSDIFDTTREIVPGNNVEYWPLVEEIVESEEIHFAFVVPETEVLVWSERQIGRQLPCAALIPELDLASFCFDKLKVATFLYKYQLAPRTFEYRPTYESGDLPLDFPFWIRIKTGAGALGALKIENGTDLSTWLSLHGRRKDFIISEYLPGRNYACKLLFVDGELIQHASSERITYLLSAVAPSGVSGMCERGRLLNRPDLVEKARHALSAIAGHLGLVQHGMFTVDFKEDQSGIPLITEINIRHVSFNYAFTLGGINFAETTLSCLLGSGQPASPPTRFDKESYFMRGVDAPLRLIP